ncbi:MAG TPA: hypothetical protein VHR16_04065, partial [Candidatus Limnocylindrales bacterium]|nr:hypothetical protein [Candidatus Limnocylindrales bacterium]
VVLLAAGFGVLGGRPERPASAVSGPAGASPVAAAASSGSTAPAGPLVTPVSRCGGATSGDPPGVMLRVGSNLASAHVELADASQGPVRQDRDPIDIPADAVAHITIAALACATGWHIALWSPSDGELYPLSVMPNPDGDPSVAQQNQFDVIVTPLRDITAEILELRAAFQLPGPDLLARWWIQIPPFPRPQPHLLVPGAGTLAMVEGCDVVLTFRNGYEERLEPCDGDLSAEAGAATKLAPGTEMSLDFDGWSIGDTIGFCGATSDRVFMVLSPPSCEQHPPDGRSFSAPRAGDWTMAIAACAAKADNRICGTWYVNVDTR